MEEGPSPVPTWKHVLAWLLDLVLSLVVFGGGIAILTGSCTAGGFDLQGGPALVAMALMVAYFVIGNRLGGTVFKRAFRIPAGRRPR